MVSIRRFAPTQPTALLGVANLSLQSAQCLAQRALGIHPLLLGTRHDLEQNIAELFFGIEGKIYRTNTGGTGGSVSSFAVVSTRTTARATPRTRVRRATSPPWRTNPSP